MTCLDDSLIWAPLFHGGPAQSPPVIRKQALQRNALPTLWRRSTRAPRLRYHHISFVPLAILAIDAWERSRCEHVHCITGRPNQGTVQRHGRSQAFTAHLFAAFELPDGGLPSACTPAPLNLSSIQRSAAAVHRCWCTMWVRTFERSSILACASRLSRSGPLCMCC